MAGAPSAAPDMAVSHRISLVRAGDGPDAAWLAEVEDLPSCSATGATPEEAVRRAWAAAEESLGRTTDPRRSGKLLVRMPATLHDDLAQAAESEGVSLNQLVTGILAGAVEWRAGDRTASAADGPRVTRVLLLANFTVLVAVAIVAVAVLVAAWR